MTHPFITDLSNLSLEEIQNKISDLMNKLNFAYRTGNSALIHQLLMVIDSYKLEYNKKMDDFIKKQNIQTNIKIQKDAR
jgi:hypothetical protein